MKISHIEIKNLFGIRELSLDTAAPVQLFAGPNGAGKSSIQNAVRLALVGAPSRVTLKKDYAAMIHDGAKKASVSVGVDGASYGMDLPKGAASHIDNQYLPLVLEPSRFASMPADERRKILFGLSGVKIGADEVRARLKRRGCDLTRAEKIISLLRSGFPAACTQAKSYATEAKGAWRTVTGETYGSDKAEGWEPKVDALQDTSELPQLRDRLSALDGQIEEAQLEVGGLLALEKQRSEAIEKRRELGEKCKDINRHLIAMESAQRRVEEQEKVVERLTAASATEDHHDPIACPHCGGMVEIVDGALIEFAGRSIFDAQPDAQAAVKLKEHSDALEMLKRTLANKKAEYDASKAAQDRLAAIELPEVDQGAAQKARGAIDAKKQARADLVGEIKLLEQAERDNAAAQDAGTQAAAHHEEVKAWLQLADAFDADGIPGEVLSEALGPINKRLQQGAVDTGWKQPRITAEMGIEADGRPYNLLSESEQWRVDAMLAESISFFSGLKAILLDRFDVLDLPARSALLNWMDWLTADGDLESALLFGTLKSCPPSSEVIAAHWIENGSITKTTTKEQAA